MDQAVLADVGAGAGLRRDDGAAAALLVADDTELGRADPTRQVHVEDGAELLQQLEGGSQSEPATQPQRK